MDLILSQEAIDGIIEEANLEENLMMVFKSIVKNKE